MIMTGPNGSNAKQLWAETWRAGLSGTAGGRGAGESAVSHGAGQAFSSTVVPGHPAAPRVLTPGTSVLVRSPRTADAADPCGQQDITEMTDEVIKHRGFLLCWHGFRVTRSGCHVVRTLKRP